MPNGGEISKGEMCKEGEIIMSYHSKKTGCRIGQFLDKKTGKCKKLTYQKGWKQLRIPITHGMTSKQTMDRLYLLQEQLERKGITFDTAAEPGVMRDWSLDWSLKGAKPKKVVDFLKENKIDFKIEKTSDQVLDDNAEYYTF